METYPLVGVLIAIAIIVTATITNKIVKKYKLNVPVEYMHVVNHLTWENLEAAYHEADAKATNPAKRTAFDKLVQKLAKDLCGIELSDHTVNFVREYVVAVMKDRDKIVV